MLFILLLFPLSIFAAKDGKVRILFTTDVHGAIFAYDFVEDAERAGSLSQVYTYVKSERKINPNLLLLDNGDMLQGQPTVYYYNFVDTTSKHLQARVMNFMGYNALTVGNHDLEPGHPIYDRVRAESNFPWLAANAVEPDGKPYFEPYKVFNIEGKKVVVLGLITPAIPSWLPESIWSGMNFEDMVESAQKWMSVIQQKEKPDVVVGLFHTGVNFNYNNQNENTYKNENAAELVAKRVKGFDAILFGHDHELYNKKIANNFGDSVLLINPSSFARYVGVVDVTLGRKSKAVAGSLVDVRNLEPDKDFEKNFTPDFNKIKSFSARKIGVLQDTIKAEDAYFGSSSFVDIVHRASLKYTNADISIAAPLMYNAVIPAGDITVGDMFKLYKYENLLYVLNMTGQEVKDFLEYSYNLWVKEVKNPEDGMLLLNSKNKFKNQYYNFDSGAGIIYTVNLQNGYGTRIAIQSMSNGEPFVLNKTYKVAMSSYRGNGGGGHLSVGAKIPVAEITKRLAYSSSKDLRYLIMMDIMTSGKLNSEPLNNWSFIPETFLKKARSVDEPKVFGK